MHRGARVGSRQFKHVGALVIAGAQPYRNAAIGQRASLFQTANRVPRGFQRGKGLSLSSWIGVRTDGSDIEVGSHGGWEIQPDRSRKEENHDSEKPPATDSEAGQQTAFHLCDH